MESFHDVFGLARNIVHLQCDLLNGFSQVYKKQFSCVNLISIVENMHELFIISE